NISIEQTGYDNWNGGTDIYSIYFTIPVSIYAKYEDLINDLEKLFSDKISTLFRKYTNVWIGEVLISPSIDQNVKTMKEKKYSTPNDELIREIEAIRNIMISVATGGARIQNVNDNYIKKYEKIELGLEERNIGNPNPYRNLWDWYEKWSSGDLPTYQSRRQYISELLLPTIDAIKNESYLNTKKIFNEPTGWVRVDRTIGELRKRLADAQTEERYQVVGLLSRETLISLAQIVYDSSLHDAIDGIEPGETDAKRMLEAYLNKELSGNTNEAARRHAKAALSLANDLTHRRTATFREAALCAEAVTSVVNIVAIISGKRNP
ncbi:MAG: hypothetical protein U9R17_10460, partial [Thermodesulfobacteriota bacterium]|nr:hypothetical protein [Thermodesulfobacteriota bacterium]